MSGGGGFRGAVSARRLAWTAAAAGGVLVAAQLHAARATRSRQATSPTQAPSPDPATRSRQATSPTQAPSPDPATRSRQATSPTQAPGLWGVYRTALRGAKYIDLTHTITPSIPVWHGFGHARFGPTVDPATGRAYTYARDGFEATHYDLATDQYGTQLDPPAHWAPEYPAIDELPPTFAVRPLVVISIVDSVARHPGYQLQVSDIRAWEARHGRIPEGSVVMVRSDWSKRWPDPRLASETVFPGVSLAAVQLLHLQRHILFHGHEPLDTDTTATLESESWLMHHGYTQAEGVAHLDEVPPTGCLVTIGYPKLEGGTGGYARYIAICPASWRYGVTIAQAPGAPLPRSDRILHWDTAAGMRVR